jgi:hypothetical protein
MNGEELHVARYAGWGRASLNIGDLRRTIYRRAGIPVEASFDVQMDPDGATGELARFKDAHALLIPPRPNDKQASALAEQFNSLGKLERRATG